MQLLEKFINTKVYIEKSPRETKEQEGIMTTDEGIHGFITNETKRSIKCEAAFQDYNLHESPHPTHNKMKSSLIGTGRKKSGSSKDDHLQSLLLRRASQSEERPPETKVPPIKTTTFRIKEQYEFDKIGSRDYTPSQQLTKK